MHNRRHSPALYILTRVGRFEPVIDIAMPVYKLTYFHRRYRPEVVRLLFALGGIPFEDNRVPGAEQGRAPSELKESGSEYNITSFPPYFCSYIPSYEFHVICISIGNISFVILRDRYQGKFYSQIGLMVLEN